MQRRFWVVAAFIAMVMGCGNERNGYHTSKTIPASRGSTVTMGRPGDHWLDTMQFVRVARTRRDHRYGYEVTYEAPGGTTFTLFWSRDKIDLRGALPNYRLENMPLGAGRVLYPNRLTQESLPNVYQAIQLIEDGHARDADGAITAAEMFGIVAALGGAVPTPRAPGTRVPGPKRAPPARASVPSTHIARATPDLGRKLDFILGKATGSTHNIERSTSMLRQLRSIGLGDTPATRRILQQHFDDVLNNASNIARTQANGRVVRESVLMGPKGSVKVESMWQGNKLITVILRGGRP